MSGAQPTVVTRIRPSRRRVPLNLGEPRAHRELLCFLVAPALGNHLFADGFRSTPRDARSVEPQGPVPLDDLLRCDRPLEPFRELWQAPDEAAGSAPQPAVSVIICTRDCPHDVARRLASLARGSRTADEVIVAAPVPCQTWRSRVERA